MDPRRVYDKIRWSEEFTVTEAHLKLLARMYVGWDDCEFGAPEIDPKRPYGNSDVLGDMAEILGIDTDADRVRWQHVAGKTLDEGEITPTLAEYLTRLHAETALVLQIGISTGSFKAGRYTSSKYGTTWQAAAE